MDQFENTKKWNKMVRDNSKYHVLWTGLALDCIQCSLTSVDFIHIVQDFFTGIATIPEPIINSGWFMWSIYFYIHMCQCQRKNWEEMIYNLMICLKLLSQFLLS